MKITQKNKVLVNFILDKSGSMSSVCAATISGVNEYIESLQADKNADYEMALTLFDSAVFKTPVKPISAVEKLTSDSYSPFGNTALYDAVCKTIHETKGIVKEDQKVLTVIMTDGAENASREYKREQLKAMIEECEKTGKWTFVFLGANQDAWANASNFGFAQQNVTNFQASPVGMRSAMATLARGTQEYACMSMEVERSTKNFFSKEDQKKLSAGPIA